VNALSYAKGPELPLLETTIGKMLSATADRFGEHEALVVRHQNVRLSWREFHNETVRIASGFIGLGLQPQDRIGIWCSNSSEWVLVQAASAHAGLVLVTINPAYRCDELAFVIRKSRMRAIVLREMDARVDYRKILENALQQGDSMLEHVLYIGGNSWNQLLNNGKELPEEPALPDSPASIQYTSGTTGRPKGVVLTHRNLANNAWLIGEWLELSGQDRVCDPCPLYHCAGSVVCGLSALLRGATLVLPSAQFDARLTLEAIESERCTVLGGVPTMYIAQLEQAGFAGFDLRSLRVIWMGGAPCPTELLRRVKQEMRCDHVLILYGQTEASPIITMTRLDDPFECSISSIGSVMPNTEAKIVSTVSGEVLPLGETGELCTRGYLVMPGYDDEPEATSRALDNQGWLHTGDIAMLRADGRFQITGRAKEIIVRGGEKIAPREVEESLHSHPKIAEVSVIGLPDSKLGEVVAAWIRLMPNESATEEEIREFCRDRIAHFKIPQYIRFVDSFPSTASGKVQRFRIREIEMEARGISL